MALLLKRSSKFSYWPIAYISVLRCDYIRVECDWSTQARITRRSALLKDRVTAASGAGSRQQPASGDRADLLIRQELWRIPVARNSQENLSRPYLDIGGPPT